MIVSLFVLRIKLSSSWVQNKKYVRKFLKYSVKCKLTALVLKIKQTTFLYGNWNHSGAPLTWQCLSIIKSLATAKKHKQNKKTKQNRKTKTKKQKQKTSTGIVNHSFCLFYNCTVNCGKCTKTWPNSFLCHSCYRLLSNLLYSWPNDCT